MRRVALTGGIATGKTTVRRAFEALDVPTIDSDALAREAVAPGTSGLEEVVQAFGRGVLDGTGSLDRRALAAIVFDDPAARRTLESIVHPYVRRAIDAWFGGIDGTRHRFAVADIPLLFEAGWEGAFDAIVVAACEPATQKSRVMARDGLSEPEARARIGAQLPIETKVERADYVIRTDGTVADTEAHTREVFEALHAQRRE